MRNAQKILLLFGKQGLQSLQYVFDYSLKMVSEDEDIDTLLKNFDYEWDIYDFIKELKKMKSSVLS
jgi:hypothetical protein